MLTKKERKQILINFLETIEVISNKKYQKRVWILAEGPEVDDFDETVCHFFDIGDPVLESYRKYNITEKQYQILNQFRNDFESFVDGDRPYLPEDFIDTPEWEKIMQMAKDVLVAFDYEKTS